MGIIFLLIIKAGGGVDSLGIAARTMVIIALRIPAMHGAKTTRNQTPWSVLLDYFTTRPSFKNLYMTLF